MTANAVTVLLSEKELAELIERLTLAKAHMDDGGEGCTLALRGLGITVIVSKDSDAE